MQNRWNRYCRIGICLSLLVMAGMYPAKAQDEQAKCLSFLQVFKKKISDADISYKYTFSMFSESSRSDIIEVKGTMYKVGKSYLDSSSQGLTLLSGRYFFKLRNTEKDAYVYDVKAVEKKMGIKNIGSINPVATIPDSLLLKEGKFTLSEEPAGVLSLKYAYSGKNSPLQEMEMKIRKADTGLIEMKVLIKDATNYKKRIVLSGFRSGFDPDIINTSKYFTVSGNGATLSNRFRSFKVNALL